MAKKNPRFQQKSNNKDKAFKLAISQSLVFSIFYENPEKSNTPKSIMRKLKLTSSKDRARILEFLHHFDKQRKIVKAKDGGYILNQDIEILDGKVELISKKRIVFHTDKYQEEILINPEDARFALDGDEVKAIIYENSNGGYEAELIEVKVRNKTKIVGKLSHKRGTYFLMPENRKIYFDIYIPANFKGEAVGNDKVLVEIIEYPTNGSKNPVGKVVEIFGQSGENEAEMHAIMAEFDLPYNFPQKVEKEAEFISQEITKDEIKKRRDFRKITTFTIDPEDAKDFDDAISVEKLGPDLYEIGVHIADVSHYVLPNTQLEREAYRRATSVYLVDRVVPMLPEVLSNNLCSLRPNEDKLTFSCVFKMDTKGNVKDVWIGRTVIHSDRRFTYEEAQNRIEEKTGELAEEINLLNDIAHHLRKQRFAEGSISFETIEIKFILAEDGTPIGTFKKIRKDSNKLIEEFMLLANKKVAEFVYNRSKGSQKDTMVYRIHEAPDFQKLEQFAAFAKRFGHNVNVNGNISKELNSLADKTENAPEHDILQTLAIRSMSKAVYSTVAEQHFGLGFKHYTHFTSPIRRYPDVMVHRLLEHYLAGGSSVGAKEYEDRCKHASDMEKRATQAERLSIKYKQVEYMQQFVGKTFEGVVSGITDWGIFVELTDKYCEGLVRLADMTDDYYVADTTKLEVYGRSKKKKYTFGQKVKVKVKKTDLDEKTIDLWMVG